MKSAEISCTKKLILLKYLRAEKRPITVFYLGSSKMYLYLHWLDGIMYMFLSCFRISVESVADMLVAHLLQDTERKTKVKWFVETIHAWWNAQLTVYSWWNTLSLVHMCCGNLFWWNALLIVCSSWNTQSPMHMCCRNLVWWNALLTPYSYNKYPFTHVWVYVHVYVHI